MVYLMLADALTVRNAISSAVDIMQAMGPSVCHLLSKVSIRGPFTSIMKPVAELMCSCKVNYLCLEIAAYVKPPLCTLTWFLFAKSSSNFQQNICKFNI
jgi:hypothetical protein